MTSEIDQLRQAWVTTVLDREDLLKALVLRRSFRRVMTTRPFVVIITPLLHSKHRILLSKEFDQIFLLDHPTDDGNGLTLKDYAKLFAFTLQIFRKCVYLDAGSLILKNCDDIFDRYNSFNAVVNDSIINDRDNVFVDSSVFFFVPSVDIYEALVTSMKTKHISCKVAFEEYVKAWMVNQSKDFLFMDPKYNRIIGKKCEGLMALEENNIGIVHFKEDLNLPHENITSIGLGTLEFAALQLWLSIYETEVAALMSSLDEVQEIRTPTSLSGPSNNISLQQPHEPTAIVGMSCRYPGANNLDEFWKILLDGQETVQRVPVDRWTKEKCEMKPDIHNTQASFLKCPVDEFDGKFFGISPKELEFLDCQQRLLLEVTYEALENAAINPLSLRGTHAGVFTGAWMYDYKDQLLKAGTAEFYRMYMGNSFGAAAARISFFLGLTGPSVATESGCSSAMVAIDMACKSIRNGDSSMAIACGVNLLLSPFVHQDISFVISPDGRCKTFDESADGFGRAEGCGVLILKRYSEAVKDGDRIWGLIRGCSAAQEGLSKSMGTPTVHCESLAMKLALEDAAVHPSQVSYVETHGTGTPVGDPMEVAAIADVYSKNRIEPLLIGSVKTNIGHTESCSAMPGIMKVVLSMKHGVIPPHRNLNKLNPRIDLKAIPAIIPDKPIPWERSPERKRLAGVSSFGITGTDGHLILEEPPENFSDHVAGINLNIRRPLHMLTLSAKTEEALDSLLEIYLNTFDSCSEREKEVEFPDICYTANVGRGHFNHRAVLLAISTQEAKICLETRKYMKEEVKDLSGKICFLFTGQGSQYHGMARELYEGSPIFRLNFEKCAQLLETSYNINIREALWSRSKPEENGKELTRTIYSQTSIFCVEYSLLKLWESWGIKPDYVLGHSLGEFAAAVAANILSLEDAIKLVAERSRLVESLPKGKMLVVKCEKSVVESHLKIFQNSTANQDKWLDYAAINSKEQTVLAGDSTTIQEFSTYCENNGLKTHLLDATHAFHSRHMEPMLPEYEKISSTIKTRNSEISSNKVKFISSVDGKLILDSNNYINSNYWSRHTREKVNFLEASKAALDEGCTIFLEIGPHPILSALTTINHDESGNTGSITCLPSIRRSQTDWQTILSSLAKLYVAGFQINWEGFDQYIPRQKVDILPHYPFQRRKHWFEMSDSRSLLKGKILHPLLGCLIPNASSNQLYQCGVTLKNLEYLKDHCIGNKVIFPGAGYLEMCLAAGHSTTQCFTDAFYPPASAFALEHLKILKPLMLENGKACQMQTIVDCSGSSSSTDETASGMTVKIFAQLKYENELPKWVQHATAQFSPIACNTDIQKVKPICVEEMKKKLGVFQTEDFYGKLEKIGLEFGPSFRSLQQVWTSKEESILAQTKHIEMNGYIIHPTIFDAMIQVAMIALSKDKPVDKLHVPLSIKKCVWLEQQKKLDGNLYIHCNLQEPDVVTLYDEDGTPLAMMEGVELIQTSVQQIETMMDNHKSEIPLCWEETWKRKGLGSWEKRVDTKMLSLEDTFLSNREFDYSQFDEISDDELLTENQLDKLVYLYILNAFYKLGWNKQLTLRVGEEIQLNKFMSNLSIIKAHSRLTFHFLEILEEENILRKTGENMWKLVNLPDDENEVQKNINLIQTILKMEEEIEFQLVVRCGRSLASILKGDDNGLRILFPEVSSKSSPSAATFYTTCYARKNVYEKFVQVLETYLQPLVKSQIHQQQEVVLRLLEVGAGAGSFTEHVLSLLEKFNLPFEYTYTDISQAFFSKAENKFEMHKKNMKFKILNIEQDPATQGFCPGYYDIVLAGDVVHATKDLRESISNIRKLLRPNGCVWLEESTIPCREVTLIFGLLEGYWRYTDLDLRPNHAVISANKLENVMKSSCGFSETYSVTCYKGYHGLIFGRASENQLDSKFINGTEKKDTWLLFFNTNIWPKDHLMKIQNLLISAGKTPVLVEQSEKFMWSPTICAVRPNNKSDLNQLLTRITSRIDTTLEGVIYGWGITTNTNYDQASISQPYLYLLQILAELNVRKIPKVFMISEGVIPISGGDYNFANNPSVGTLCGISKSFHNEYPNIPCRIIDLCVDDEIDTKISQIFAELWIEDKETQVAYRDGKRLCNRLTSTKLSNSDLPLPHNGSGERFQLLLPSTKSISDLKFIPLPKYTLAENEIEIGVRATALNFRDILAVLKPNDYFEKVNKIGLDICGIVTAVGGSVTKWQVGDQVFGCNLADGALPSHTRSVEDAVTRVPSNLTFAECATLPAVFSTVYYSLVMVSKLQPGETVLIHTASGGVGLSAIQVAKHIGAKIIATAGSSKKRAYLRNLGIEHVFHSRNTKYEQEILKVTEGKGVHVVLNSLTSPGFKEATLKVCGKNARFVEMSKLSIWTEEEVKELRPDVDYTIIDLTTCSKEEWKEINENMGEFLREGHAEPIPYVRFDAVSIREALTYLQKAKHIGKVVCIMPEFKLENGRRLVRTPLFNNKSTYLITGGLGGIGFEVAKWMCIQGASNLVLVGRKAPNEIVSEAIKQLMTGGANIIPYSADVGDLGHCEKLMEFIKDSGNNLPPLRGIMHCAGVLSDGILSNQTWDKFQATYNAKVNGTLNLHLLTKQDRLEHFVMFSSIASLFGPPGQSNHAAANGFLDSLMHFRQSQGLVGTSVNWGAWGQVGVAVGKEFPGVPPFSLERGLNALGRILRDQRSQVCVAEVQMTVFQKFFGGIHTYLEDVLYKDSDKSGRNEGATSVNSELFWKQLDCAETSEEKLGVIRENVKSVIRQILKLDKNEPIDDNNTFQEIGLDSLMMVEMKNLLQGILGKRISLTANDLKDCSSISLITQKLDSLINCHSGSSALNNIAFEKMTSEEFKQLIRDDSQLPPHIRILDTNVPARNIKDCRIFMITGVTGNLGPYFIRDLFKHTLVTKIYCLVRAKNDESGRQRLISILTERGLLNSIDLTRISCVAGDLTKPKFGLSEEIYENLADEVDAVIHSAVKSSHIEIYRKSDVSSDIRNVNVKGTISVLQFATLKKTKHVLHASTLLAVSTTDDDGSLSEDWPNVDDFDNLTQLMGYPISKFICDMLMKEAVLERKIPCKVFRLSAIAGDSITGRFNYQNNHLLMRLLSYMRVRAMPCVPLPLNVLPVDTCADITLSLFFNPEAPQDIYNVCQEMPQHEQAFVEVAKEMGYEIDVVEFADFVKKLEGEGEGSLLYSLRDLYLNEELYTSIFFGPEALQEWFVNPEEFFKCRKVAKYYGKGMGKEFPSSMEIIKRDLRFAKEQGIFQKLGV